MKHHRYGVLLLVGSWACVPDPVEAEQGLAAGPEQAPAASRLEMSAGASTAAAPVAVMGSSLGDVVDAGPPCTATDYPDANAELVGFPGVRKIDSYGDGETTLCMTASPQDLCVSGTGRSSRLDQADEYHYWGAAIELDLATESGPFDATALGITAVRFELTAISGRSVIVATRQVDDPRITEPSNNFSGNAFRWGGSSPIQTHSDAIRTVDFSAFKQDRYTTLIDPDSHDFLPGLPLDPSQLSSLSFLTANNPSSGEERYHYCVRNLQWLGADGVPIEVPRQEQPH